MQIIFLSHNSNVSFIRNELKALEENEIVSKVIVYTDTLPEEEIYSGDKIEFRKYGVVKKAPGLAAGLSIFLKEIWVNRAIYRSFSKIKNSFLVMRNEIRKAAFILENGVNNEQVLYSYWAGNEAFVLSWLKNRGIKNLTVTRMHAFDIYEEFDNGGKIPWRWLLVEKMDRFVTISKHGEQYFTNKYPSTTPRTQTFYLGISTPHEITVNIAPEGEFNMVSCARVSKHKNLEAIFNTFQFQKGCTWYHIGDGEYFDSLKKLTSAKSDLKVKLFGSMSQAEIRNLYQSQPFTCFISLSTTEGIPVSMMEALSHGIPVVSTDVGGCAELVNSSNGVLLPTSFTNQDVIDAVKHCATAFSGQAERERIRKECMEKFSAAENYRRFFDYLNNENRIHLTNMS